LAFSWQIWKEDGGKDVKGFMLETTKADEEMLEKYHHQQQQSGWWTLESDSSMEACSWVLKTRKNSTS
jgi:hypothetical protein